jgi:hypothetical protein
VEGEQTAGGFVIIKTGAPGVDIVTWADSGDVHPEELVTVKVNTPPPRFVIVLVIPLPEVAVPPGNWVIIHEPEEGKPLSTTLPVGTEKVG